MKHLVVGLGEVGSAIQNIFKADGYDKNWSIEPKGDYDMLHICIPFNEEFHATVELYQKAHNPKWTVIHSTVPVGTTKKLGGVHSPIRGVHPFLYDSIMTFVKYVGGEDSKEVAQIFKLYGLKTFICKDSDTTELMKILDTSTYGLNILIEKETARLCELYGVPLEEVYTHANDTYNEGYATLGMPQFHKYNIKHMDGKIGGHCIMQNAQYLETWINDVLKEKNELF